MRKSADKKPMTAIQVLKAARKLLSVKARWTQGESARTKDGLLAGVKDADASCWCAAGAIWHCSKTDPQAYRAMALLESACGDEIAAYNDRKGRTHEQILAWFDRAIKRAEAQ